MDIFLHTVYIQIRRAENWSLDRQDGEYPQAIHHIAVCPPQFHTTVSSEQCCISAVNRVKGVQWEVGPGVWRVQQLMNGALSPWENFKQARSISQVEHRWLSHARRPSAQRLQMHQACPLTRQTDWNTDQEWASYVTHTSHTLHTLRPKPLAMWDMASRTNIKVPTMARCRMHSHINLYSHLCFASLHCLQIFLKLDPFTFIQNPGVPYFLHWCTWIWGVGFFNMFCYTLIMCNIISSSFKRSLHDPVRWLFSPLFLI